MIGFHYTTTATWKRIQLEGLKPMQVTKPEIMVLFPSGLDAIYLYIREQDPHAHLSMLLYCATKHQTWDVVLLEVEYSDEDAVRVAEDGIPVSLTHNGMLWGHDVRIGWDYHVDEPMLLLRRPVPPERVRLLGRWDLVELAARVPELV